MFAFGGKCGDSQRFPGAVVGVALHFPWRTDVPLRCLAVLLGGSPVLALSPMVPFWRCHLYLSLALELVPTLSRCPSVDSCCPLASLPGVEGMPWRCLLRCAGSVRCCPGIVSRAVGCCPGVASCVVMMIFCVWFCFFNVRTYDTTCSQQLRPPGRLKLRSSEL